LPNPAFQRPNASVAELQYRWADGKGGHVTSSAPEDLRSPVSGATLDRRAVRLLAVAWILVVVGAVVLVFGYGSMPSAVILYRPPWAAAPTIGAKSFLTVGRVVLMGVGQLGAATVMVLASRGSAPWERFWRWLGLVAGVKTILECVALLMPHGSPAEQALTLSTFGAVGIFAVRSVWWWRRGDLRAHPSLTGGPLICLLASLALWAVFAIAPRLLA
jgi:hypothetical protein